MHVQDPDGTDTGECGSDDRLFFFQAEDGIRDVAVTGVQTCALPISWRGPDFFLGGGVIYRNLRAPSKIGIWEMACPSVRIHPARFARRPVSRDSSLTWALSGEYSTHQADLRFRSEERRVGKECRSRW